MAATIEGYVRDLSGTAIENATVATANGAYDQTTDSFGYYSMAVVADTYTLEATKSGYTTDIRADASYADATTYDDLDFLIGATQTVSGTVTDSSTNTVQDAVISASLASGTSTGGAASSVAPAASGTHTATASGLSVVYVTSLTDPTKLYRPVVSFQSSMTGTLNGYWSVVETPTLDVDPDLGYEIGYYYTDGHWVLRFQNNTNVAADVNWALYEIGGVA